MNWDLATCFKIIEKNQNFTLYFPKGILAFDGLRVLLFFLLKRMQHYQQKEDLDQFNSNMRKIYILLLDFKDFFDAQTGNFLLKNFHFFLKQGAKKNFNELDKFLRDFEFVLREGDFYKNERRRDAVLKEVAALKIRKKIVLFKKFLVKNFSYKEFLSKSLELGIFLECFCPLFEMKSLDKLSRILEDKIFETLIKKRKKFLKLLSKNSRNLKANKG
ncbi:hypothetical protein [Campylobacter sp.]|uniref:hypothetical protein n=1 Tax=Campylobacter sp. TaxID=205 RepID=UPI0026DBD576|nr:hypothetical protein [Campylobacter sp.]MDO4673649.1 hypothetical protein [Campylobacter sp.]